MTTPLPRKRNKLTASATYPAPTNDIVHVTLNSSLTTNDAPVTFGHVFKRGDIPSGRYPAVAGVNAYQAIVTNRWSDGSAKLVTFSTLQNIVGGVPKVLVIGSLSTPPVGASIPESALGAPRASVQVGGYGTVFLNGLAGSPWKQHISGSVCSGWIYRGQVGINPDLVGWFDVRIYSTGAISIWPWVENGYLQTSTAVSTKSARVTVTYGANTIGYDSGVDISVYPYTNMPLVQGEAFDGYWLQIADPQVVIKHDTVYLMASKLVPHYGWTVPTSVAFSYSGSPSSMWYPTVAPITSFVPFGSVSQTNQIPDQGDPGYAPSIGHLPAWDALYLTSSADPRMWKCMQANTLVLGSYSTSLPDPVTNDAPLLSSYPNLFASSLPTPTGAVNPNHWDGAHSPSPGYLQYLITGRYWYLRNLQLTAYFYELNNTYRAGGSGNNGQGIHDPTHAGDTRRVAWQLRILAWTIACSPDGGTAQASWKTIFSNNMTWQRAFAVDGTYLGGIWKNNLGAFGMYATDAGEYENGFGTENFAPWQQNFLSATLGLAWDLELQLSTQATTDHQVIRDFGYKHPIGMLGNGTTTGFPYSGSGVYLMSYGTTHTSPPPTLGQPPDSWFANWNAATTGTFAFFNGVNGPHAYNYNPPPPATPGSPLVVLPPGASSFPPAGYIANLQPAIAYAVDHGAPGANTAWGLLTTASNWVSISNTYNDFPLWGITPRSVSGTPAWRTLIANDGVFHPIAGSNLSALHPANVDGTYVINGQIVDQWNSMILDEYDRWWSYIQGGHVIPDNGIYYLPLRDDAPTWKLAMPNSRAANTPPPSAVSQWGAGVWPIYNYGPTSPDYGRPGGTHGWYAGAWCSQRQRLLMPGIAAPWANGSPAFGFMIGYDPITNAFDPLTTYPDNPIPLGQPVAFATHPTMGDIYTITQSLSPPMAKWTQATNTWSRFTPTNIGIPQFRPSLIDVSRNRFINFATWSNPPLMKTMDLATQTTFVDHTMTGFTFTDISDNYNMAVHDLDNDRYILVCSTSGAVYAINPTTFVATKLSTIPTIPATGINAKVSYSQNLGGIVFTANVSTPAYFMATR